MDDEYVVFRAQTLTLPDEYKNISIPIKEIRKMEQGSLLFLPTVKIYLKDRDYKFVVFNRKDFFDTIVEIRNAM